MLDTVLTLLVNGGNGPVIRDGIGQPTVLAWHRFPTWRIRTSAPEGLHTVHA